MSQTPEERRAYIRGYNRGRARAYDLWRRLADIAQGYRQRLREPVMQRRCQECRRWTRGSSATLWGFCSTDFDGHEPRMWADHFVGDRESRRIVTQEGFGCVNWLPHPARRGAPDVQGSGAPAPNEAQAGGEG
jgi:hypothetical protein